MLPKVLAVRLSLLLFAALCVAGCPLANEKDVASAGDDNGGGAGSPPPAACSVDTDCALAAATCCDCPTFAVGLNDPAHRACTGVTCPGQNSCPDNVEARCSTQGTCELACTRLVCPVGCSDGFVIDEATGCLSCGCAMPLAGGCQSDAECVETRADCCGCHFGGMDTAVRSSDRGAYDAMLGCPASPQCPIVDVCETGAGPHCVQGRCELARSSGFVGPLCGRGDLPGCDPGYVCTVNQDPRASKLGVGVCVPQL